MTFIASVVAKKGVAVIADSLVTSSRRLLELQQFMGYLENKEKKAKEANKENDVNIDLKEVFELFEQKTSHTKDYEEKLFEYDKYTAITTAGAAAINKKRITEIISELVDHNKKSANRRSYAAKNLETKVKDFCAHVTNEVKKQIQDVGAASETIFILTNYNKTTHQTTIYKIEVSEANKTNLDQPGFEFVKFTKQDERFKIVCDGQNRICERILFGDREALSNLVPKIIDKVIQDFKIDEATIPEDYMIQVISSKDILNRAFFEDMKIFQLTQLSLQQAVDLACLLMRIEMDFQKYTKNIPTVGGIIKLAIIDDNGFKFINGEEILKPEYI